MDNLIDFRQVSFIMYHLTSIYPYIASITEKMKIRQRIFIFNVNE